ncbi:MAG: hypothetical protein L6R41_006027 [Letrouitia leprolyta]|nr:MAG: hypothetical protein L6R41_006027 [Letrouitia leprolyta]
MAFANTIEALRTLALGDFEGRTDIQYFSTERYPRPIIAITSSNGADYKRKYAIWGLVLALNYLTVPNQCGMSHFTFTWHGTPVVQILYTVNPPHDSSSSTAKSKRDANTISTPINQMVGRDDSVRLKNSSSTSLTLPLNATSITNTRLQVRMRYLRKPIAKLDMVLSILYVLSQAAAFSANQPVPILWAPEVQNPDCTFHVESSPRSSPPLMTYAWVIEVVARAADILIDHHVWKEVEILAFVDAVSIGKLIFT